MSRIEIQPRALHKTITNTSETHKTDLTELYLQTENKKLKKVVSEFAFRNDCIPSIEWSGKRAYLCPHANYKVLITRLFNALTDYKMLPEKSALGHSYSITPSEGTDAWTLHC